MQRKARVAFYLVCTLPFFAIGRFLLFLRYESLLRDYDKCKNAVLKSREDKCSVDLNRISKILIYAEDHRNRYHFGVDFIGILRAFKVRFKTGRSQGASTIDQQFIRAITGRKERNMRRKIREQLLACLIRLRFPRDNIVSAYIKNAYYGEGYVGATGLIALLAKEISEYEVVAYIKFPLPSRKSLTHEQKIRRRVGHIIDIERGAINLLWL